MSFVAPQPVDDRSQNLNNTNTYYSLLRLRGQVIDIDDTGVGADTEFSVTHGLARVPENLDLLINESQTDAYLQIKPSGTTWTDTLIYLKCNTANAAVTIRVL